MKNKEEKKDETVDTVEKKSGFDILKDVVISTLKRGNRVVLGGVHRKALGKIAYETAVQLGAVTVQDKEGKTLVVMSPKITAETTGKVLSSFAESADITGLKALGFMFSTGENLRTLANDYASDTRVFSSDGKLEEYCSQENENDTYDNDVSVFADLSEANKA